MPDTMSMERRLLMKAYGAELILTEGAKGMQGSIEKANELAAQLPGSMVMGQFDNPANPKAHYETTGPEIWQDADGQVDCFVAGVGTGGTITGTGRYLKEQNPSLQVVAVEPAASPLLSTGKAGAHGLQGIGANFVPTVLDRSIYDEIAPVTEREAYAASRMLGRCEGLFVGISSGAALHAAILKAQQPEYEGKTIVALLPDTGERYLSTPMMED
jgi:cysteine synthase A